jgi:glycosyltransferase involved in cell wall biosynthesis
VRSTLTDSDPGSPKPSLSFIVPAYNEAQLLGSTLTAIDQAARALHLTFEMIVVDDASLDRTPEVAHEHGARVVPVSFRQIAATRNAGAREARGEWLVFVDADTTISAQVLQDAVGALRGGAVGGGSALRFDGYVPRYGRVLIALIMPVYRALGLAAGCFLFCTRRAFDAVGGFDENLFAAEEAVLSRALRRHGRFILLRSAVVTSARKLRAHSAREVVWTLLRLAFMGPRAVRRRDGLDIWYGHRRADPEGPER